MDQITLSICPRCQQRFLRSPNSGDYVHTCHGTEVLRNEDVLLLGPWEDFTGSDPNVQSTMLRGAENKLFGTRAWVEGDDEEAARTSRGFPQNRWRTRQHLHYIEDSFFNVKSVKRTDNPEDFND